MTTREKIMAAAKQSGLYVTGVPQWLEVFHAIAQSDGQRIAELEAERDNAWEELREIRAAISANPEESTLDEVVKLRQQLAATQEEYGMACHLVAQMHFAATGEDTGPKLGVVEDVAEVRRQLTAAQAEVLEQARIVGMGAEREIDLRQQLAAFHSAVEHVTEDGCTRRSVVAMPEGWAMVHKDRLHDLELAEEQLAEDTAAGRDAEAIADAIRAMKVRIAPRAPRKPVSTPAFAGSDHA